MLRHIIGAVKIFVISQNQDQENCFYRRKFVKEKSVCSKHWVEGTGLDWNLVWLTHSYCMYTQLKLSPRNHGFTSEVSDGETHVQYTG